MTFRLVLASSNPGKLHEFQALATGHPIELASIPGLNSLPPFDESAPTFAENAAGKALHYSRFVEDAVLADDSGLVVPALGGAPGPQSARYAGANATDADRIARLLAELRERERATPSTPREAIRGARFVCVLALAKKGRLVALISDRVEGRILDAPRGDGGFGYDPVFFYEPLGKSFAELSREEKNQHSHRGRAFRKLLNHLQETQPSL